MLSESKVNVDRFIKSFLAAIQMGHESNPDNSVDNGNAEK